MKMKKPVKIIGERNINLNIGNKSHQEQIVKIGKALSSPVRIKILNLLKVKALSIQEIAETLNLPLSSTAHHISCLEEAKMIVTETQPGLRGSMRVCVCSMQSIHIDGTEPNHNPNKNNITVNMPIGNYYSCDVEPTCGLADENGILDTYDSPKSFYSPLRTRAQLIWFHKGRIEYRFPNYCDNDIMPAEISFSMEICSEAPGYMEDWPSDITVSVNGKELGTYRSPGDFGARPGILTPPSWGSNRTQYGLLKTFSFRENGGYIDGRLVNPDTTINDLNLRDYPYISLTIEIKDYAEYVGGINIFGEKFGDYPQGIVMKITY